MSDAAAAPPTTRGPSLHSTINAPKLQRARSLLKSTGEPVQALEDVFLVDSSTAVASDTSTSSNSNWNPYYEKVLAASNSNDLRLSPTGKRRGQSGLGASIKRKLKGAGTGIKNLNTLARSKSTRTGRVQSAPLNGHVGSRGHGRSQSESFVARPDIARVLSLPEMNHNRHHSLAILPSIVGQLTSPVSADNEETVEDEEMEDGQDVKVPLLLQQGTPMVKVSLKKKKLVIFRIDPDEGCILWESKKSGILALENIKELRFGADARYYREQFQLSQDHESRWLSIIYIMDGSYKTLHLVATTEDAFHMWAATLRQLYAVRQELMSGLGNVEKRQAMWERRYWKGADEGGDQRLDFAEVEKMCRRLNINFPTEDLMRRFQEADTQKQGYLDFTDFQRFVKLIKIRPELNRLYKKLCSSNDGVFDFMVFQSFMRDCQKSSMSRSEMEKIFKNYAVLSSPTGNSSQSLPTPPTSPCHHTDIPSDPATHMSSDTSQHSTLVFTLDSFTSFLLSPDNSVFTDHHGTIYQDMSHPLPEYYISSSHNTYLVGHQLVGVSTIEGYIRALLHSCRSVELDIYDGDTEPMIYHGKTLTSRVPLRDICQAIAKYAFVASPYPIIISAEVHCSLPQQNLIANILREVFGDTLITAPLDGRPKVDNLPSPEDLKGRVLLKAKNLYVGEHEPVRVKGITVDAESSTSETTASSASDSEMFQHEVKEIKHELKHELQKARNSEPIKELKQEIRKARGVVSRVRAYNRSPPSSPPAFTSSLPPVDPQPQPLQLQLQTPQQKVKMSLSLVALLVYTVGVKCRGFNKKEHYPVEHVFSLSERTANKVLKQSLWDLVKHNRTHVVRIYPNGTRLKSSNFEPHKYWASGAQLVAINWQTFDLGYMINHAMFQRNGRAGYVLKPLALRDSSKDALERRTKHFLDITVISAQQLPRPKDSTGYEIIANSVVDPYVEVSIHIPDWAHLPFFPEAPAVYSPSTSSTSVTSSGSRSITCKTGVIKNNGFNPVWEEKMSVPFDCVGGMMDLVFVKFAVMDEHGFDYEPLAVYCISLGSLQEGYRHLPLHDSQLSQYLFSTLFVHVGIRNV